jgi:hypothetical protein
LAWQARSSAFLHNTRYLQLLIYHRMNPRPLYIFLFYSCISITVRAQHISGAMQFQNPVSVQDSNSISLSYSNLFYFRDYEYFHNIQTGYTLFGTWHYPRITVQPTTWLKLEAGALLQKDFGDKQLDRAWPVFSLQLQHQHFRFLFGALEGHQSHGLIEPLMSYDKMIERPIEEGFQFKWKTKRISADIWLDWERRQKENADHPEELTGGLSFTYTLTNPGKPWQISIPVQFIAPHKGGQLDTNHSIVTTVLNSAIGLKMEWNDPNDAWLKQVSVDAYYAGYKHMHKSNLYPFEDGNGFLANLFLQSKWNVSLLASYWKGSDYIAPKGGKLFQSISSIPGREHYTEPERQLLFLNLLYEKELTTGFFIDLRYHPYFDLRNHFLEHAFLILLSYRDVFKLGKLKK